MVALGTLASSVSVLSEAVVRALLLFDAAPERNAAPEGNAALDGVTGGTGSLGTIAIGELCAALGVCAASLRGLQWMDGLP